MAFDFSDVLFENEPENMGGFNQIVFFAPIRDIETFPTLVENPSTDDEAVELAGDFTMKPGKHFIQIYTSPETVKLEPEIQGEHDGKSFKVKGEFFVPGTKNDVVALSRKLANARGVLILVDPNSEERICIGTQNLPAYFSPKLSHGQKHADRRGATIEFESDSFVPGMKYNGLIPLDGSVNPTDS